MDQLDISKIVQSASKKAQQELKEESKEVEFRGPGQPVKLTPIELEEKINDYWKNAEEKEMIVGYTNKKKITQKKKIYTITGLVLHCGYADRQSFYDLEKLPQYSCIIRKARTKIQQVHEERLQSSQPVGSIFALKCMGWIDDGKKEDSSEMAPKQTFNIQINHFLGQQNVKPIPKIGDIEELPNLED